MINQRAPAEGACRHLHAPSPGSSLMSWNNVSRGIEHLSRQCSFGVAAICVISDLEPIPPLTIRCARS